MRTNAMNYSITIKKNWNDAHNNKQLTMPTIAWRTTCIESAHTAHLPQFVDDTHRTLMAQVLSAFTLHPWSSTWHTLLDSPSPLSTSSSFLLSVPVYLFHLELFPELHYTKVMANLRCSAAEESEDTLNAFTSLTGRGGRRRLARWWILAFSGDQTCGTAARRHGPCGAS